MIIPGLETESTFLGLCNWKTLERTIMVIPIIIAIIKLLLYTWHNYKEFSVHFKIIFQNRWNFVEVGWCFTSLKPELIISTAAIIYLAPARHLGSWPLKTRKKKMRWWRWQAAMTISPCVCTSSHVSV